MDPSRAHPHAFRHTYGRNCVPRGIRKGERNPPGPIAKASELRPAMIQEAKPSATVCNAVRAHLLRAPRQCAGALS